MYCGIYGYLCFLKHTTVNKKKKEKMKFHQIIDLFDKMKLKECK